MSEGLVLEARELSKHYGGVIALDRINLEIRKGELLALIGDNGAGKSTLVNILCGALRPSSGQIHHRGEPVEFHGPLDARMRGIEAVYQDLALAPFLDVASNLYLGRELTRRWALGGFGMLNRRSMARESGKRLEELGVFLPAVSGTPVRRLSGGQRQAVAVARAAAWATDVLFLDEPTASLGVQQSEAVLALCRRLVQRDAAVVLITHTLPYVMECADRIVVFRHGRKVADLPRKDATSEGLVSLIVGFDRGLEAPSARPD